MDTAHTDPNTPLSSLSADWESVKSELATLASLVPKNQYYRYHDLWGRSLQQICFLAAFQYYLAHSAAVVKDQSERLIKPQDILALVGGKSDKLTYIIITCILVMVEMKMEDERENQFYIPIEDYLHGLVSLSNELSRLAVTSVIMGNTGRPAEISEFLHALFSAFQLLNLRNDSLRRRFDSIKVRLGLHNCDAFIINCFNSMT